MTLVNARSSMFFDAILFISEVIPNNEFEQKLHDEYKNLFENPGYLQSFMIEKCKQCGKRFELFTSPFCCKECSEKYYMSNH